MLYCQKHSVWAYKSHKCNIHNLIPLSKECRIIADTMYHHLGLELLSAGCFVNPIPESIYEHRITFNIEFRYEIPPVLMIPAGWTYYTEIVGTDFRLSALGYSEVYVWDGIISPSERCQAIADDLSVHLTETYDRAGLEAVLTLYNTGV